MFNRSRIAKLMKGRWPAGAPGAKGGQFAPKSVIGGNGNTIMAPQYGIGLNPASKAQQEAGPAAVLGDKTPRAVMPKIQGTPHPNRKPGDPDVKIQNPSRPSQPDTWDNPEAVATFTPTGALPAALNGVPLTSWRPPTTTAGWASVSGQDPAIDPGPLEPVRGKNLGAGVVIREPDGRVWLTKPTNHFGGYQQTFPKGTVEGGLSLQASAIKEAYEETGLKVKLVGHFADVERDTSVARYYLAERVGGTPADMGWETQALRLAPPEKLAGFLNRSHDQEMAKAIEFELPRPGKLRKAGGKAGNHHSQTQARWPAGTPLGGQWMAVGADGLVVPPTLAGGYAGKNQVYQAKADAALKFAQTGNFGALGDMIVALHQKVEANKAKVAAGGASTSHMKWTAQLHQYVSKVVSDAAAKPKAEAAVDSLKGPAKLASWGKPVAPKPGGSNPGAIYTNPEDGKLWLVKGNNAKAKTGAVVSDARAKNEVLAAKLTALAGAGSVDMKLVDLGAEWNGGLGVATKMISGATLSKFDVHDPAHIAAARADFAVHAWLANYDVLGMGYDNTVLVGGKATCIDPGGALLFRAQGQPKDPPPGPDASEWETMRKTTNEQAAVFGGMTQAELQESAKKVAAITNDQIAAVVGSILEGKQKDGMVALLTARRDSIVKKAGLATAAAPVPAPAKPATTAAPKVSTPAATPPVPPLPNTAPPDQGGYLNLNGPPLKNGLPGMILSPTAKTPNNVVFPDGALLENTSPKPYHKISDGAEQYLNTIQTYAEKFMDLMTPANGIKDTAAFETLAFDFKKMANYVPYWVSMKKNANALGADDEAVLTSSAAAVTNFIESKIKVHNTAILKAAQASAQVTTPAYTPKVDPPAPTGFGEDVPAGYALAGTNSAAIASTMLAAVKNGDAEMLKTYGQKNPNTGLENYPATHFLATHHANMVAIWQKKFGAPLYPPAAPAPAPAPAVMPAAKAKWPLLKIPDSVSADAKEVYGKHAIALMKLALSKEIDALKAYNKVWSAATPGGQAMTKFYNELMAAAVGSAAADAANVASGAATITAAGGSPHRATKAVLTPVAAPAQPPPAMPNFEAFKTKSPANAASHNAKIDKIAAMAAKGDTAGLLAMKFGSNTYGKQQQKAANAALAAMGSSAKVVENQPAGSHPALVVGAANPTPPAPKAAPKPAAPLPAKVPEGPEAAAKLATRLPQAPDFFNWQGKGSGLSSQAWKNKANQDAIDSVKAAGLTGTMAALQNLTYPELDASGNPTGVQKPLSQHPSKYVQDYHSAMIAELDEVLNPKPALAFHNVVSVKNINDISAKFKGKPFGTTVKQVPKAEQFGFWVALGKTARDPASLKPAKVMPVSDQWKTEAAKKYKSFDQLSKWFIAKTQYNSDMAMALRAGAKEFDGVNLAKMNDAVHKDAVELPAGSRLTRWHEMDSGMVKQLLAAPDGMVIQATAQMSTSTHPTATTHFGPHEVTFITAPGAKVIPSFATGNHAGEYELSTLPGARFVLLSKHKKPNGFTHMEVLLLPPEK